MDQEMEQKKGTWTEEEDKILEKYMNDPRAKRNPWGYVASNSGLIGRNGSSCRQRWFNYLDPKVNRAPLTAEEKLRILEFTSKFGGNQWSRIAEQFPGRTDNQIKNFWYTHVERKAKQKKCDINEFQKNMIETLMKGIKTAAVAGSIGGYDCYEANIHAPLLASPLPGNGGIGGAAATWSRTSFTTNADHANMSAETPTSSYGSTTTTDEADIDDANESPSDLEDIDFCSLDDPNKNSMDF